MGVARDFGPLGLNAREFRRAGLNPRWWLGRRVNQSATDAVGGVVLFCVKRRGPLPAGRPPPFRGAARTPFLPRTLYLRRREPSLRRRGPPLFRGSSLATAVDPSPPFRLRGADPLSSTDPLSLLQRPPPYHSVVRAARTPSLPRTLSRYCSGPLPTIPSSGRRGPPLFHGPSLFTAADPSPPFRRPSARTPSLPRTPLSPVPRIPSRHCR
ncbi:hypothetical protein niasHT_024070 [Heterodera trifolii]|uniref:Uncharacterized protein n=1 Tax=Heterodera trifolii TaxID=157864 RepID=A0ABD2JYP9_9BILA